MEGLELLKFEFYGFIKYQNKYIKEENCWSKLLGLGTKNLAFSNDQAVAGALPKEIGRKGLILPRSIFMIRRSIRIKSLIG